MNARAHHSIRHQSGRECRAQVSHHLPSLQLMESLHLLERKRLRNPSVHMLTSCPCNPTSRPMFPEQSSSRSPPRSSAALNASPVMSVYKHRRLPPTQNVSVNSSAPMRNGLRWRGNFPPRHRIAVSNARTSMQNSPWVHSAWLDTVRSQRHSPSGSPSLLSCPRSNLTWPDSTGTIQLEGFDDTGQRLHLWPNIDGERDSEHPRCVGRATANAVVRFAVHQVLHRETLSKQAFSRHPREWQVVLQPSSKIAQMPG